MEEWENLNDRLCRYIADTAVQSQSRCPSSVERAAEESAMNGNNVGVTVIQKKDVAVNEQSSRYR